MHVRMYVCTGFSVPNKLRFRVSSLFFFSFFLFFNFAKIRHRSLRKTHHVNVFCCPEDRARLFVAAVHVSFVRARTQPGHHIFVRREPLGGQRKSRRAFWFPALAGQVCSAELFTNTKRSDWAAAAAIAPATRGPTFRPGHAKSYGFSFSATPLVAGAQATVRGIRNGTLLTPYCTIDKQRTRW